MVAAVGVRTRLLAYAVLLPLLAAGLFWSHPRLHIDDALITYRYAENLADGLGFAYNPGERVQGTTAAGYTLLLAALYAAGANTVAASTVINFLASLAVAVLLFELAVLAGVPAWLSVLACWAAVGVSDYLPFAMVGMEGPLYAALIFAAFVAAARGHWWPAGVLAGAACLVRPDGVVVILALLSVRLLLSFRSTERRRLRNLLRDAGALMMTALCVWGPWLLWAHAYFGSPWPQTLAAKQLWAQGLTFAARAWPVLHFCTPSSGLWALATLGLAGASVLRWWRRRQAGLFVPLLLPIYALGYLTAFLLAGIEQCLWYLMPITPVMVLAAFVLAGQWVARVAARGVGALAATGSGVLLLSASLVPAYPVVLQMQTYVEQLEAPRRRAGRLMARCLPEREAVAMGAIGHVGYCYRGYVLDCAGLVSPRRLITAERVRQAPLKMAGPQDVMPGDRVLAVCYPRVEGSPGLIIQQHRTSWRVPVDILGGPRPDPMSFDGAVTLLDAQVEPAKVRPGQRCIFRFLWRREDKPVPAGVFPAMYVRFEEPGAWFQDFSPFLGTYPVSAWQPGEVLLMEELVYCPRTTPPGRYPVRVGLWVPEVGWLPAGPEGLARTHLTVEVVP